MERNHRIGLIAAGILALTACRTAQAPQKTMTAEEQVARGKYLVTIMDCATCHTPMKMGPKGPELDMERFLSGHPEKLPISAAPRLSGVWAWAGAGTNTAFAGPWGISVAPNITPDQQTGMGIWTEEMFIRAMRTGKHFGESRPILPPMPWPAYAQATDDDLKAVFAYLRSVPPVSNKAPDSIPAEPK